MAGISSIKKRAYPSGRACRYAPLLLLMFLIASAFFPHSAAPALVETPAGACDPGARPFAGYSFLVPEIINKNAAYAPFFVEWDDYYQRFYFNRDIQKEENVLEWKERFCEQAAPLDIEYVVYEASFDELADLREAAADPKGKHSLPYTLLNNSFAEVIVLNGCTEVIDYLMFAKKCEPYVIAYGGWRLPERDPASMQMLIEEGRGRFGQTQSYFIKLRYAYQIVRLAHYAGQWQQTVDLYNDLLPKVDRRKTSVIYFWTLGHLAGALQRLGKYPEAAYRYALVFRFCPSKRTQAYRSFLVRNDQDWEQALRLCQNDAEKSTLYLLRAGGARTHTVDDMRQIFALDPGNPQLDLLLVSELQQLEKVFLSTPVTDRRFGEARGALRRNEAAAHLLRLQAFVREALRAGKVANPKLWRCAEGYLELLANDNYAAVHTFDRAEDALDLDLDYDSDLKRQLEVWRTLAEILRLDPRDTYVDEAIFRIRSYETFKQFPAFEPFLQDYVSTVYAQSQHPGKAILAAYPPEALGYNPSLAILDDLLRAADEANPILLEKAMRMDTNPDAIRARLLERKGAFLLGQGQPEAAVATMRAITPTQQVEMARFSPFKEVWREQVHFSGGFLADTAALNRLEIAERIVDHDFRAKAALAVGDPEAARLLYLNGLAYYNMSYFGYAWSVTDYYRSGYNWLRLAQGPVFPLRGSPDGNREHLDLSVALGYFERALAEARDPELAARAAFMAARCQQKMWFQLPDARYSPGSRMIPVPAAEYRVYYDVLQQRYSGTAFYGQIVKECKWFEKYTRR